MMKEHSPRKAIIYSAICPGLCQVYNKKYWKVPIIYGAGGAFAYFIGFNHLQYTKFRDGIETGVAGEKILIDGVYYEYEQLPLGRDYYRRYRDANASTDDFRRAMEEASGQELGWFFRQWLYRGGLPVVEGTWRYDAAARTLVLDLRQVQDGGDPFVLPMEVALAAPNGSVRMEPIRLSERSGRVLIPLDEAPTSVTLDPGEWVLMEASLRRAEP